MVNNRLKEHIVEIVDNQLRDNEPRCVKDTFEKLISMGYKDKKAKEMIGAVLIEEMYYIMKNQQPFNEKRYSNKLAMLPNYKGENIEEESEENYEEEIVQMPVRNENKIGRNEPCPCGSGKKYKKCCGKNV